jgi:MOSC domain-containing protein YiiM
MAEIFSIVYKPHDAPDKPKGNYSRIPLETAQLIAGYGIEGDRKGGHPERQLNVMSYETLAALGENGLKVTPGAMGEQIIVRGLDIDSLAAGDRVQLGTAWIEIVEPRRGCARFEAIQQVDPKTLQGRMGMIARVIEGGAIRVGDPVALAAETV